MNHWSIFLLGIVVCVAPCAVSAAQESQPSAAPTKVGAMATLAWPCWGSSSLHARASVSMAPAPAEAPAEVAPKLEAAVPADTGAAKVAELPRRLRWQAMEVRYRRADVRHPALYYDSVQEKMKHDDARADNVLGAAAACLFEIVQFPVQLAMTPALMVVKPPWTIESAEL